MCIGYLRTIIENGKKRKKSFKTTVQGVLAEKVMDTVRFLTVGSCQHPVPVLVLHLINANFSFSARCK